MRPPHLSDASQEEGPISTGEVHVVAQGDSEKGKKQTERGGTGEVSPWAGKVHRWKERNDLFLQFDKKQLLQIYPKLPIFLFTFFSACVTALSSIITVVI